MSRNSRHQTVPGDVPGTYHCWQRCVRRAFLMGNDPYSGKDYSHRRAWIIERLQLLVSCFAIEVAFHSVLSNHFHLVVRTLPRLTERMGRHELARRWLRVYPGKRVLDGQWIEPTQEQVEELANELREDEKKLNKICKRLSDVSWFMGALNEYVARRSNLEDEMSGKFWQSRFKCRNLKDADDLLICGIYVDLNQVRAGLSVSADAMESSVACRMAARLQESKGEPRQADAWLAPFTLDPILVGLDEKPSKSGQRPTDKGLLPMTFESYLQLLDEVGRAIAQGSKGTVSEQLATILDRLSITWERLTKAANRYLEPCERELAAGRPSDNEAGTSTSPNDTAAGDREPAAASGG